MHSLCTVFVLNVNGFSNLHASRLNILGEVLRQAPDENTPETTKQKSKHEWQQIKSRRGQKGGQISPISGHRHQMSHIMQELDTSDDLGVTKHACEELSTEEVDDADVLVTAAARRKRSCLVEVDTQECPIASNRP